MIAARNADTAALCVLSLIWGSSFALVKIAVDDIPPLSLAAGRIALGAILLLAAQAVTGPPLSDLLRRPRAARWRQFLILGMLGNGIPFALIGYGETRIGSGLAAILIGTMPLFTLLFAHIFAVERGLSRRAWGGIALGFAGLILLIGPAALADLRAGQEVAAQLAIVLAGASYAATAVYGRVLSLAMPVPVVAAGSMTASALVMVPLALLVDQPWRLTPGSDALLAVATLGLGATAFASLIYFRLLRSAGPTFASLVNYLIPAFGFALGVVWLAEPVSAREIAALTLILAAIALVRAKPAVAQAASNP